MISHRFIFSCLFIVAGIFLNILNAYGLSLTLGWDPNPANENVTGYRLYYGAENNHYDYVIDVQGRLFKKITLKKGQSYYFAVKAYNRNGFESDFSEQLGLSSCTFKLSPGKKTFKDSGGIGYINVKTQPGCEWSAVSEISWLTIIEGERGIGPGKIAYSIEPNESIEPRLAIPALSINQVGLLFNPFAVKPLSVKQKGRKD